MRMKQNVVAGATAAMMTLSAAPAGAAFVWPGDVTTTTTGVGAIVGLVI